MSGAWCGDVAGTRVAQFRKVDAFEEALTGAEQYRGDRNVHLVNQPLAKVLLDDIDSATNTHVFALRGFPGSG